MARINSITQLPISFPNGGSHQLRGVVYTPKRFTTAVIMAHGFPGDSSGGTHRRSLALSRAGFLVMRFDFTGCGASDGTHEERLMSGDVRDLRAAIRFLSAHVQYERLVLLGHSTGALTVPFAAQDRRVDAVILSSGQGFLDRGAHLDFTDKQVRELWLTGHTHTLYPMNWSAKRERISKKFYDEFFTLPLEKTLKKLRKPALVIHGERDEAVPVQCARDAFKLIKGPKRLVIIPKADHRFIINSSAYQRALISFLRGFTRLPARTAAPRARAASLIR